MKKQSFSYLCPLLEKQRQQVYHEVYQWKLNQSRQNKIQSNLQKCMRHILDKEAACHFVLNQKRLREVQ